MTLGLKTPSQSPSAKLPSAPHPQFITSPLSETAITNLSPEAKLLGLLTPSTFPGTILWVYSPDPNPPVMGHIQLKKGVSLFPEYPQLQTSPFSVVKMEWCSPKAASVTFKFCSEKKETF